MLIKAVVDTNVFISGILTKRKTSPTRLIIDEIYNGKIIPIYNVYIIKEYIDVLYRKKFGIREEEIHDLIKAIVRYGIDAGTNNSDVQFKDNSDKKFFDSYFIIRDAFLITGNIKHFPKDKNILTPREFWDKYKLRKN